MILKDHIVADVFQMLERSKSPTMMIFRQPQEYSIITQLFRDTELILNTIYILYYETSNKGPRPNISVDFRQEHFIHKSINYHKIFLVVCEQGH